MISLHRALFKKKHKTYAKFFSHPFVTKNMSACKLIVFDMDGTLTLPQRWMFKEMRESINLPLDSKKDILGYLDNEVTDEKLRSQYHVNIKNIEKKAMLLQEPQPGLNELLAYLHSKNISKNIVTRNYIDPVQNFIAKFVHKDYNTFDVILTRSFKPPKPSPQPLLHIITNNINPETHGTDLNYKEFFMVGDSYDDMKSGRDAGFTTILVVNETNQKNILEHDHHKLLVDHTVTHLAEIINIIEQWYQQKKKNISPE